MGDNIVKINSVNELMAYLYNRPSAWLKGIVSR